MIVPCLTKTHLLSFITINDHTLICIPEVKMLKKKSEKEKKWYNTETSKFLIRFIFWLYEKILVITFLIFQ